MTDPLRRLVDDATPASTPPFDGVVERSRRRRIRRRATVAAAAGAVAAVIVSSVWWVERPDDVPDGAPPVAVDTTTPGPAPTTAPAPRPTWSGKGGLPVFLELDGERVRVDPWTYCGLGTCADGSPRPPYLDAGARDEVTFTVPERGWTFEATYVPLPDEPCGRRITLPVRKTGAFTFVVEPGGPAARYRIDLFGRGPSGDTALSFTWTTPTTGAIPQPAGYVSAHYTGLELGIDDVADTASASAVVEVTYADRAPDRYGPVGPQPCFGGNLFFRVEDPRYDEELAAPVEYRVVLTLDGEEYVGTATWPRDEISGNEPYAALTFEPALPGWDPPTD